MLIFSAEELDALMAAHPQRLVVLEASFTWCRPCKGFTRPYEVGRSAPPRPAPPRLVVLDLASPLCHIDL